MLWNSSGGMEIAAPGKRPCFIGRILAGISLSLACCLLYGCGAGKSSTPPSGKKGEGGVPVSVVKVGRKDVPVDIQIIGNVEAYLTISVKAQVGGILTKVYFQEGDYVKKGDLLFSIDPRPIQAQLQQMEATLAKNRAQQKQAEANLARDIAQAKYADAQAGRYAKLMQEGVISKEQSEQMRTNSDAVSQAVSADQAAIESAKAEIAATQAMVENIHVQAGYTEIRSPIDGRTGNLAVKQGNVVNANVVDLITINQVQPIYVTFAIPEAQLGDVKRYMAAQKLPVMVTPQDDEKTETGVLTFIDNSVDAGTGTIKLKGTFQNNDRKLWPGQFVRVKLRLTTKRDALVVPNQAVQSGQNGDFVFVVKPDRSVESRPIVTSARLDQDLVVDQGLEFGETIVTEGQLRLGPGVRVNARDNARGREGKGGQQPPPAEK